MRHAQRGLMVGTVLAAITDTGSSLVIASGDETVTLKGVKDISLLHMTAFTFV